MYATESKILELKAFLSSATALQSQHYKTKLVLSLEVPTLQYHNKKKEWIKEVGCLEILAYYYTQYFNHNTLIYILGFLQIILEIFQDLAFSNVGL